MRALDDAIRVDPMDPADDRVWCPTCEGDRDQVPHGEECGTCRSRGWVHEDEFAELVDEEEE